MSWPCFGEHLRDKLARQKVAPCIASNIEHKTNDKRGFHSHHLDEYMACSQQKIDILFWCFYHNLSAPFKSIPYSNPTGKDWWKKKHPFRELSRGRNGRIRERTTLSCALSNGTKEASSHLFCTNLGAQKSGEPFGKKYLFSPNSPKKNGLSSTKSGFLRFPHRWTLLRPLLWNRWFLLASQRQTLLGWLKLGHGATVSPGSWRRISLWSPWPTWKGGYYPARETKKEDFGNASEDMSFFVYAKNPSQII